MGCVEWSCSVVVIGIISKSLNYISSLKTRQEKLNEDIKKQISEFENGLIKVRQHKWSIYRRQKQLWRDEDGKDWTKDEIITHKNNLKLQAVGDNFVMAFRDLEMDFKHKFQHISHTGPIANYNRIANINAQKQQQQQQQQSQSSSVNNNNNTNDKTQKSTQIDTSK